MKNGIEKTNAVRILEQKKIDFKVHDYTDSGAVSGEELVAALGEDPDSVFKTLVTVGKTNAHYVFLVPVSGELDLKKAAAAVGEKKHCDDKGKRAFAAYGLYPRRLLAGRDEKILYDGDRRERKEIRTHLFQRR